MGSVGLSVFMARHVLQQMAIVLCKRRKAAMDTDRPALRVLLWCSATALQYLARTTAITCALRLVAKHHSSAEPIKTTLIEYYV